MYQMVPQEEVENINGKRKPENNTHALHSNFCVLCEQEGHGWTQCQTHKDKRTKRFRAQQEIN